MPHWCYGEKGLLGELADQWQPVRHSLLYTPTNVVSFGRAYSTALTEVNSAYYSLDFDWDNWLIINTTGRYMLTLHCRLIITASLRIGIGSFVFSQFIPNNVLSYGKLRVAYAQTSGEPNTGNFGSGAYQDASITEWATLSMARRRETMATLQGCPTCSLSRSSRRKKNMDSKRNSGKIGWESISIILRA